MNATQIKAAAQAGEVTPAYIRMILAGTKTPSLKLALAIFDATGEQHGPLANISKRQVETARKMAA